jgi:hypothetical protein
MNYVVNKTPQIDNKLSKLKKIFIFYVIFNLHFCQLPSLVDPIQFLIQSIVIRSTFNQPGNSATPAGSEEDSQDGAVTGNQNNSSQDIIVAGYYDGNAKIMRIRQDGTIINAWTMVLDLDGDPVTTLANRGMDFFSRVRCDNSGNLYAAATYKIPGGTFEQRNVLIKKYDPSGIEITAGWNKVIDISVNYMDVVGDMVLDSDSNLILSTRNNLSNNGSGNSEGRIFKYNPDGSTAGGFWPKQITGVSHFNFCGGVNVDSSGNVLGACVYYSATTATATNNVWWLRKWDALGTEDTTWDIRISNPLGSTNFHNFPYTILTDSNGDIVVGGMFRAPGATDNTAWYVRKLNGVTKSTIWSYYIDSRVVSSEAEAVFSMQLAPDDGIFIVGQAWQPSPDPAKQIWGIRKLDVNGNLIPAWTKNFASPVLGGTVADEHSGAGRVVLASDGKVYIAGYWGSGPGITGQKGKVMRFNPDGTEDTSFNPGILDIAIYNMDLCKN